MEYQIICINIGASNCIKKGSKIISVGASNGMRFLVRHVIEGLDSGNKFCTIGTVGMKKAYVEKYICDYCGDYHIRSCGDVFIDNNLEELPNCPGS